MMTSSYSQTTPRFLGVTAPISVNKPTSFDVELTTSLIQYLKDTGVFESDEESEQREIVLGKLNQLVKQFVLNVGELKGLPEGLLAEAGGKIFTFGSYRLGVHSKGADIDTLCVTPQHVDRSDFFGRFYQMLQNHSDVSELTQVPDAYVPVINMKFAGISIDLVFARLMLTTIPEDLDLLDHNLLKNLDEKCILSLNGSRTTDEILRLVPNVDTFHTSLRCIKLWARNRGLYSNAMGYLGGVACALLTARICQLYPNAAASTIITRFFKIYQQWEWPKPIYLKQIEDFPLQMKVWNPRIHASDRYHRMPVITPAYPSMCSTHNVSASTLYIMTEEFKRGSEVIARIEQKMTTWTELFEKTDFFHRFRIFFQLVATCETEQTFRIWSGYIESRVRHLVIKLESEPNIVAAPPYPQGFELKVQAQTAEDTLYFHKKTDSNSSPPSTLESTKTFYTVAFYVALYIAPPPPITDPSTPRGPRRLILDQPVADFKFMISNWDKLTPDMLLHIRDIKRDNLPDYVFGDQPRPISKVPPSSSSQQQQQANPSRKRQIDESTRQVRKHPDGILGNGNLTTWQHQTADDVKRTRSNDGIGHFVADDSDTFPARK